MKSVLAIIPARGGSKRIPRKNIKDFLGKPIIAYSIKAALESGLFEEVMVSTDDSEISEIATRFGAKVPFLRSIDASGDTAGIAEVVVEVLEAYKKIGKTFDQFCCIFPCAPFTSPQKLKDALDLLNTGSSDIVFPVVEFAHPTAREFHLENGAIKLLHPEHMGTRTQDLKPTYHDTGQFYFGNVSGFDGKSFWNSKCSGIPVSSREVQDIDVEDDWILAEAKYKLLQK